MSVTMQSLGIDKLSIDDRLILAHEIQESVQSDISTLQIPDWHLEIIRERLRSLDPDSAGDATWEELQDELLNRPKLS